MKNGTLAFSFSLALAANLPVVAIADSNTLNCIAYNGTRMIPTYLLVMNQQRQGALILSKAPFNDWKIDFTRATVKTELQGPTNLMTVSASNVTPVDWSKESVCYKVFNATRFKISDKVAAITGELTHYPIFVTNPDKRDCRTPNPIPAAPVSLTCNYY